MTHRKKAAFDRLVRIARRFYYWLRDIQDAAEQRTQSIGVAELQRETDILEHYRRAGYTVGPRGEA